MFSIVLKFGNEELPQLSASKQFSLSCITALSVISFLNGFGIDAKVKWPNDIYVGNRKICGMLIENSLKGALMHTSVIGIGMNVNETDFPENLPNPVSMSMITGKKYEIEKLLCNFLEIFDSTLDSGLDFGLGSGRNKRLDYGLGSGCEDDHTHGLALQNEYITKMYRKDTFALYRDLTENTLFECKITGVTPLGKLKTTDRNGNQREFSYKEIEFIIGFSTQN